MCEVWKRMEGYWVNTETGVKIPEADVWWLA